MHPLDWNWLGLLLTMIAYWVLVISWWVTRQRQQSRAQEAASVTQVSETEIVATFEGRINVIRASIVLLGPTVLLLLVWHFADRV